jgi:hypothetical protein
VTASSPSPTLRLVIGDGVGYLNPVPNLIPGLKLFRRLAGGDMHAWGREWQPATSGPVSCGRAPGIIAAVAPSSLAPIISPLLLVVFV